ncbi:uncharacterized protein LOC131235608 isoform X2 [Magnolia sinica]|uniref:uncharacterized protein LOC131235608 isoform X2 n=1 Tax=Magnolia sinica TaxID=86752 RepID=UPI0026580324|nr:uncharacterized protein LOC131235608 isoform X2 [Magnolia sinica]
MDLLDDILLEPSTVAVRAAGKFKPKPKFRANSKPASLSSSVMPCTSATATLTDPSPPSSATEPVGPTEAPTCIDDNGGVQKDLELPRAEAGPVYCGSESLDGVLPQPIITTDVTVGALELKDNAVLKYDKLITSPTISPEAFDSISPPQNNLFHDSNTTTTVLPSVDSSVIGTSTHEPMNPEILTTQDLENCPEAPHSVVLFSEGEGNSQRRLGCSEAEEAAAFSGLESLDDLLFQPTTATVQGVSKFRPKPIARRKNENTITLPSSLPEAVELVSPRVSSQIPSQIEGLEEVPPSVSVEISSISPCSYALTDPSPHLLATQAAVDPTEAPRAEEISSANGILRSVHESLGMEVAPAFPDLESLDEIIFQPAATVGQPVGKFRPKPIDRPKSKKDIALPKVAEPVSSQIEELEGSTLSTVLDSASVELSISMPCISAQTDPSAQLVMIQEADPAGTPYSEDVAFGADGDLETDLGSLAREEASAFSGMESMDDILFQPATTNVRGVGKFRPKSKGRTTTGKPVQPFIPPDDTEPISSPLKAQFIPETECLEEVSADAFVDPATSTLAYPSAQFGSQEAENHVEVPNLEAEIAGADTDLQNVPGTSGRESANSRKMKNPTVLKVSVGKTRSRKVKGNSQGDQDETPVSSAVEQYEAGNSSRQLRKRTAIQSTIDDIEDENYEPPNSSAMDECNDSDDDYRAEDRPKKKGAPRATKGSAAETDKPVRRRRKASEEPDPVNKDPPKKKFSHSTRRNRRKLSKALLETPEEDIDPKKLIMKDLIMLAEHNERKFSKEAAAARSFPTRSGVNSFSNDSPYDDDDPLASTQGVESDDDHANHRAEPSSKLNYHSFMNRTPTERWSKSDTEMFYEAIRQFGTDFAMIQQLFPGRTRHQVKLKYKAEERKHPLQLSDALIHRSKDLSHFELVIERLQAQAEQNSNRDMESLDATGGNEEDAVESELKGEEVRKDSEHEFQSPVKSHESQDVFEWSQYGSANAFSPQDMEKGDYNAFSPQDMEKGDYNAFSPQDMEKGEF